MLLLALVLLALSATFSGAEASLFTLSTRPAEAQPPVARRLLRDPVGALTLILVGNLAVNLSFFAAAALWASRLAAEAAAAANAAAVALVVLFGEILPKVAGHRAPSAAASFFLPPVWILHRLVGPLPRALGLRLVPGRAAPAMDSNEVLALLGAEGRELLGEEERRLLQQILELGKLRARALRRPLSRAEIVSARAPLGAACQELRAAGLSWAAVQDVRGDVRGVLDLARDLRGATVEDAMAPVPVLPELAPLSQGVTLLRRSGAPFVLLVDEHGGASGVIERGRWADALLDRLPERPAGRLPAIAPLGQGRFRVQAELPLHEFQERFGAPGPPGGRVDTVGGLVQARLGRLPRTGDRVRLGGFFGGLELWVVHTDGTRVLELEARPGPRNDGTPRTHPQAGSE